MKKWAASMVVVASTALLTACGGAPSESDVYDALNKQIKADIKNLGGFFGLQNADQIKLHSVNLHECKEDGEKAYVCDLEWELEIPGLGRKKGPLPATRFVEGEEGWRVSQ